MERRLGNPAHEIDRSLRQSRTDRERVVAILLLSLVLVVGNIFRKLLPLLVNHDVPLE